MEKKALVHKIGEFIYLTTEEEIKEGDWGYNTVSNSIFQCREVDISTGEKYYINTGVLSPARNSRKIVATTNPELSYLKDTYDRNGQVEKMWDDLPKIPLSFVKEYVEKQVKEVKLEYKYQESDLVFLPHVYDPMKPPVLKLDSQGCVIISPIEEKVYTRQDMFNLAKDIFTSFNTEEFNEIKMREEHGIMKGRAFGIWFNKNYPK